MAKQARNVNSRKSTIRYEMTRDFVADYTSRHIPEFTAKDEIAMKKIFSIPNLNTCVVTGQEVAKSGGDHLFEVRGYFKKTGKVGIEQRWNRIPVLPEENKRYKKYEFVDPNGKKYYKNIGFEDLSDEELESCSLDKIRLYQSIKSWFEYCDERGVKLFVQMPKKAEEVMNNAVDLAFEILENGVNSMVVAERNKSKVASD